MSEEIFFDEEQSDALVDLLIEQKTVRSPKLLTKSKFLNALQCPKLLWTRCNAPQEIPDVSPRLQSIFDAGHRVGKLATRLFPGGAYVQEEDFIRNLDETRQLLVSKNPKPIYEAGIQSGRLYSRADILNPSDKKPGMWDVIEIKCSTKCKDVYLQDIAFQKYCYQQFGLLIDRCYLMHINNKYVRDGEINPKELFALLDVTEDIKPFYDELPELVDGFLKIIDLPKQPPISIREHCNKPYECQMKPVCWAFLPESNVTQLSYAKSNKFDLVDQGILLIKDIPNGFKLTDRQQIQRNCAITGREYVEKLEIDGFVKRLQYPLYFMDFETIFEVIPRFNGTRPYQQVPFQFSVHIQKEPKAKLEHISFLHKTDNDPRKDFIRSLKGCIGETGTILVYHQTFEEGRLKELGGAFPEFEAACQSVVLRLADLKIPFSKYHYLHPKQNGSASLKKVLPALVGLGYEGLTITEGGMASTEYIRATYNDQMSAEERTKIYADLEAYCTLDTKAMVDILESLRKTLI